MTKTCKKCLLTTQVEGVSLDTHGVCNFCREWEKQGNNNQQQEKERELRKQELEEILRKPSGNGEYDCILSFSGGKDSCYLLYKLVKDYNLHDAANGGAVGVYRRLKCCLNRDALQSFYEIRNKLHPGTVLNNNRFNQMYEN